MTEDIQNPLDLPADIAAIIIPFVADAIDFAHATWPAKWGLTDYEPDVRINVGWTEMLTTSDDGLRIIGESGLASSANLDSRAKIQTGDNGSAYYRSIPGSVCIEMPYLPIASLPSALQGARPALFEAIRRSHHGLGKGVREGHSPDMVREIGRYLHRTLPQPDHLAQFATADRVGARGSLGMELMEGALCRVVRNRFERRPTARAKCIAHFGTSCQACGFSFRDTFGEIGEDFIHVHHISPIAKAEGQYVIDPIRDLIPICPNCHAMLHIQDPPLTVEELRIIRQSVKADA